ILVRTRLSTFFPGPQNYRMVARQGNGFAWEAKCDLWHMTQEYMICVDLPTLSRILGLGPGITVQARSLVDGQVRWSYETGEWGGEALDANGRLMLANEEWRSEEHERGTVRVGRVKKLTVLDLENGHVLATTDVQDVVLRGWSGHFPPNHEFDGERVLLRRRRGSDPECPEHAVRVYTLDLTGHGFQSRDECEAETSPSQSRPESTLSEIERKLGAQVHRLEEGELVSFGAFGDGTLLELRSERGHWQAVSPLSTVHRQWRFTHAFEKGGLLFIESNDWGFGTLDCVQLASGRPLWRYVFPAVPVLTSTNSFAPPYRGPKASELRSLWNELRKNPLPTLASVEQPLPLEEYLNQRTVSAVELVQGSNSVIFDPAGIRSLTQSPYLVSFAWALVAVGLGVLIVPIKKRLFPPGSIRWVLIAVGLSIYLIAFLLFFGGISLFTTLIAKLLLVGAYLQSCIAGLRVHTRRGRWLLRAGFVLLLLPLGWFVLMLFLMF
ncbi:MAG: hypothetical protein V3R58_02790, partial [candidate division NC10 bacterium]